MTKINIPPLPKRPLPVENLFSEAVPWNLLKEANRVSDARENLLRSFAAMADARQAYVDSVVVYQDDCDADDAAVAEAVSRGLLLAGAAPLPPKVEVMVTPASNIEDAPHQQMTLELGAALSEARAEADRKFQQGEKRPHLCTPEVKWNLWKVYAPFFSSIKNRKPDADGYRSFDALDLMHFCGLFIESEVDAANRNSSAVVPDEMLHLVAAWLLRVMSPWQAAINKVSRQYKGKQYQRWRKIGHETVIVYNADEPWKCRYKFRLLPPNSPYAPLGMVVYRDRRRGAAEYGPEKVAPHEAPYYNNDHKLVDANGNIIKPQVDPMPKWMPVNEREIYKNATCITPTDRLIPASREWDKVL